MYDAKTLSRFHSKYIPEPNSGCWLWDAGMFPDGYGVFGPKPGQALRAHRVSYEIHVGPIPDGLHVLHKCDVRGCVNPQHLFLGTNDDNVADKVSKRRQACGSAHAERVRETTTRGEAHHASKLTDAQVEEVRAAVDGGETCASVARRYGVSRTGISAIARGVTRGAHVKELPHG